MCYFGNEIQQDNYGSGTATLLEELFRVTRIFDLERLPKHDPTRFILLGKGRTRVVADKAKSDIWQQRRYHSPYVRSETVSRSHGTTTTKRENRLAKSSTAVRGKKRPPRLIFVFSQPGNRLRLPFSHWRDKSDVSRKKLGAREKENTSFSPFHLLTLSLSGLPSNIGGIMNIPPLSGFPLGIFMRVLSKRQLDFAERRELFIRVLTWDGLNHRRFKSIASMWRSKTVRN